MKYLMLINPEVKSAYFDEYLNCSLSEFNYSTTYSGSLKSIGPNHYIEFETESDDFTSIEKLSSFQGLFSLNQGSLTPLQNEPNFKLSEHFIFGSKFKGKTNERFTQLMLNIGLSTLKNKERAKILDPMCGRATTLLWAMRYGLNSKGIEADFKAINDISQIVKKWAKVCEIPFKFTEGFIGKKTKNNVGKFLQFDSQKQSMKVVIGNSTNATELLAKEKFNLLISDIPYGIQHLANKGAKNPLDTLKECLPEWRELMAEDSVLVIGHNSNNPKRRDLEKLAIESGLDVLDFSIPHRMSESIIRDVIVLKKNI